MGASARMVLSAQPQHWGNLMSKYYVQGRVDRRPMRKRIGAWGKVMAPIKYLGDLQQDRMRYARGSDPVE